MNYDPVCGETRRGRQTYGNACEAGQDRARIVYPGECRRDRSERPVERLPRRDEYACPQIYQPVCANLNGQTRTFGNACSAGQQGAQVIYDGECRSGRDDRQRRRPDPTNRGFEIRPM
ncbi:MAG: Kazal-type serine protease inhibitor [Mesorhizobium sp.]|nr:Kazal-type serine protease inhibitor [Mesorhizobium sp.]